MAKSENGRGGKLKVVELLATCLGVGPSPAGGHRATLAIDVRIEGPNGEQFRGAGSRLFIRVYPVPVRGTGKVRPKPAKKKAAAARA